MSPRRGRLLLLGVVAGVVALLSVAGLERSLSFYRTPSEVLAGPAPQGRFRLGGEVVPGSLRTAGGRTRFELGDGARRIPVEQATGLPGTVREGQEVVVEGALDQRGVFESDTVMAKHGNEYRPARTDAAGRLP